MWKAKADVNQASKRDKKSALTERVCPEIIQNWIDPFM